jgi:hypothetical protein
MVDDEDVSFILKYYSLAHTTENGQGLVFGCEAEGTSHTFRLVDEHTALILLQFRSMCPQDQRAIC